MDYLSLKVPVRGEVKAWSFRSPSSKRSEQEAGPGFFAWIFCLNHEPPVFCDKYRSDNCD